MLKTIQAMESHEAAKVVHEGYSETLTHTRFPAAHRRRIRTNNAIEWLNREMSRQTRIVGTFPGGNSALMLVTARLKCVAENEQGSHRYMDVTLLDEQPHGMGLGAVGKCARILTEPRDEAKQRGNRATANLRRCSMTPGRWSRVVT